MNRQGPKYVICINRTAFYYLDDDITRLMAIFQEKPCNPVQVCLHSAFYWS